MSTEFPRCPVCAAVLETHAGVWQHVWPFGAREMQCGSCRHTVALRDARIMGQSFASWASELRGHMAGAVREIPIMPVEEALHAMSPGLDMEQVRTVPTLESLIQFVSQINRSVLTDQAHGRSARVEVVVLEDRGRPAAVGILGRTSRETGEKETELVVARVGQEKYLTYLPLKPSARVREALRMRQGMAGAVN